MTPKATHPSRYIEDAGMIAAIGIGTIFSLVKISVYAYCSIRAGCAIYQPGFPTEFWLLMLVLVLPKTIGRASAGKVWEILANRGGKPDA